MPNTQTSPKVSIIMPTYNRAAYILETIESIRNQTYQNWELIIVDDGSEDNTDALVGRLADQRVFFYEAGRTGITGKIKNIGLQKAVGDLIAFIDPDDLWAPGKLEKQVAALQQYPEAGFSLTGGYNFRKLNEPVEYFYKQKKGINCGNVFIPLFRSEVSGFIQSLMLRRECLDKDGPFLEVKAFSDIDFIVNLGSRFKAVILYEPLLYRRLHDSNYSHSNWEKGYDEWIEIVQSYREKGMLPSHVAKDALFRLYINFGEKWLLYGQKGKAVHHFFKAWKNKPFSIIPFKKIAKAMLLHVKKHPPVNS